LGRLAGRRLIAVFDSYLLLGALRKCRAASDDLLAEGVDQFLGVQWSNALHHLLAIAADLGAMSHGDHYDGKTSNDSTDQPTARLG
jgi:hypothetical protein